MASTYPRAKDLASGTLAESVSASTTTLLVYVGEGSASTIKAVWPDTPFYASIMPSTPSAGVPNSLDSEIVKVTAVSNDQVGNTALTVTRAQRGTTGKAFTAGAIVTNAYYAEDAGYLVAKVERYSPGEAIWTTTHQKVPFNTEVIKMGNLSLNTDTHSIVIGDGISWVEISANIFYEKGAYNYGWCIIKKNGSEVAPRSLADCSGGYGSVVFSPFAIPVQSGDVITIHDINGSMKIRPAQSWVCVRQIA